MKSSVPFSAACRFRLEFLADEERFFLVRILDFVPVEVGKCGVCAGSCRGISALGFKRDEIFALPRSLIAVDLAFSREFELLVDDIFFIRAACWLYGLPLGVFFLVLFSTHTYSPLFAGLAAIFLLF